MTMITSTMTRDDGTISAYLLRRLRRALRKRARRPQGRPQNRSSDRPINTAGMGKSLQQPSGDTDRDV